MFDSNKDDHHYYQQQQTFDHSNQIKYLDRPSMYAYQSLPPTPSSSARSFMSTGNQDPIDCSNNNSNNATSLRLSIPKPYYGSFLSSPFSSSPTGESSKSIMMPSDHSVPSTPPHTTISPDDDEEGLYLAWTHQMLREQGLRPQSCHGGLDNDEDDDSSVSDDDGLSYDNNHHNFHHRNMITSNNNKKKNLSLLSWLVCFPTSCFQK
ncbi:hypothetical protein BDA99DRAFT_529923 [Phascolomyces articulosus]|uniref:Uncharacterized protein n=1 Tax=Phascolomyces articulosus TaxID=60185 RepID=A0AAD5JVF0_9FUNG|nr:hypothetical protein BDA99DRAFT_529923 [Phascolomyces articulosus]